MVRRGIRNWWNRPLRACVALLLVLLAFSSCGSNVTEPDPEGLRILFIGNSLTYSNEMPGMLALMLDAADVAVGRIETVAFPDFGLEDHWTGGPALSRIAEGDFDVVVMQQGPSATEGRPSLLEYSQRFAGEIRAAGGSPALYMVWPSVFRDFDFDGVSDSYRTAAEQVDGILFPAGEAWRAAWQRDPDLALYAGDGFHPSPLGSYLAALVMFGQLAGSNAAPVPPALGLTISDDLAALLQEAAAEANTAFAR
jgi:hypothetical protein